jgi:hypothetical protein
MKTLMDDTKLNLYEVARLFRFYYVDKMIKKHYPKLQHWNGFTGKLTTGSSKTFFLLFVQMNGQNEKWTYYIRSEWIRRIFITRKSKMIHQ